MEKYVLPWQTWATRSLWLWKSRFHWILDFSPVRNKLICCVWINTGVGRWPSLCGPTQGIYWDFVAIGVSWRGVGIVDIHMSDPLCFYWNSWQGRRTICYTILIQLSVFLFRFNCWELSKPMPTILWISKPGQYPLDTILPVLHGMLQAN